MTVVNRGASAWLIDTVANPPLVMLREESQQFELQNMPASHPFNINTTNTTGQANLYNNDLTNNGATAMTTISFVVPFSAPDTLHYNCGNHASMNGPITILTDFIFMDGFDLQAPI